MQFVITVPSKTDASKAYTVRKSGHVWTCDCPDHVFHSNGQPFTCKHIAGVSKSLFLHVQQSALSKAAARTLQVEA